MKITVSPPVSLTGMGFGFSWNACWDKALSGEKEGWSYGPCDQLETGAERKGRHSMWSATELRMRLGD